MQICNFLTPLKGMLFFSPSSTGTQYSASLEGHKCLEGYFKILILKYSPDFLFFTKGFWSKALKSKQAIQIVFKIVEIGDDRLIV